MLETKLDVKKKLQENYFLQVPKYCNKTRYHKCSKWKERVTVKKRLQYLSLSISPVATFVIEPTFTNLPFMCRRADAARFPSSVHTGTSIQTGIAGAFVII